MAIWFCSLGKYVVWLCVNAVALTGCFVSLSLSFFLKLFCLVLFNPEFKVVNWQGLSLRYMCCLSVGGLCYWPLQMSSAGHGHRFGEGHLRWHGCLRQVRPVNDKHWFASLTDRDSRMWFELKGVQWEGICSQWNACYHFTRMEKYERVRKYTDVWIRTSAKWLECK